MGRDSLQLAGSQEGHVEEGSSKGREEGEKGRRTRAVLVDGQAWIFDAQELVALRAGHRLVPTLLGCLPAAPQQNVIGGLPGRLQPSELVYCLARDLLELQVRAEGRQRVRVGVTAGKGTVLPRERRDERVLDERALEKRRAREQKRALGLQGVSASEGIPSQVPSTATIPPPTEHPPEGRTQMLTILNTPEESSLAEIYRPPTAGEIQNVVRPDTHLQKAWDHLHDRGYWLAPGIKFGADFAVYPADPLRYHSHFDCLALKPDQEVPLSRVVGWGRLGTQVKKVCLLVGEIAQRGMVEFSIEWAGMGT